MFSSLLAPLRARRARRLATSTPGRRIRIHSIAPIQPEGLRVAFEFLEKPGPWSMQFYEAAPDQTEVAATLAPGTEARFHESHDGARTRVLVLADGRLLLPR